MWLETIHCLSHFCGLLVYWKFSNTLFIFQYYLSFYPYVFFSVYTFKSVGYAVDSSYLPDGLKHKYVPSCILGKGACGEVRLTYNKVSIHFVNLLC